MGSAGISTAGVGHSDRVPRSAAGPGGLPAWYITTDYYGAVSPTMISNVEPPTCLGAAVQAEHVLACAPAPDQAEWFQQCGLGLLHPADRVPQQAQAAL